MGGCAFDTRHAVSKFTLFNRHQREFQDLLVTKQCFVIRPDALTFTAFRNLSISKSERIEIDVLQDEAYDFRNEITNTVYTSVENYASVFEQFSTNIVPRYLNSFETYLRHSDNKNFFVGSRLSLVDFVLYELFWQMTMMVPNSITESKRPTLFAFIKAFEKESRIAHYQQNENHIELPINMPWASFT